MKIISKFQEYVYEIGLLLGPLLGTALNTGGVVYQQFSDKKIKVEYNDYLKWIKSGLGVI